VPSCEPNDDLALSFTSAVSSDNWGGPASSLPARLHPHQAAAPYDDTASAASSPSGVADLSIDSDRGGDLSGTETGPALPRDTARSQSPFNVSRRAIMSGDSDLHQRSSSPLKRRASSMDPENDTEMAGTTDAASTPAAVAATSDEQTTDSTTAPVRTHYARAMSVDVPSAGASQEEGQTDSAVSLGGTLRHETSKSEQAGSSHHEANRGPSQATTSCRHRLRPYRP
jgi:ubiquitin carboxyl-terminal hydrolase 4/11